MSNTVQRLGEILRAATGSQRDLHIDAQSRLEDIVTSSLQFVVILSEIERVFEITVPEAYLDPARWGDLGSIAQMIEGLSGNGGPG